MEYLINNKKINFVISKNGQLNKKNNSFVMFLISNNNY